MNKPLRVLVVGLGNMGASHARAYHKLDGFELAGLCARSIANRTDLPEAWAAVPRYADYGTALAELKPDVVSINTWPNTHASFALRAIEAGAHVFIEKPLAETVEAAQAVVDAAVQHRKKLVVGYILRVHPSWTKFIEIARTLGKPLVMRMNLNQQSVGPAWNWHRNLMESMTPLVDCGVHYVDVMCQMTQSRPVRVHGIGAKLSDEVKVDNYGHLHVEFEDGSVGWYEAGWGPMMSEVAFFVKDVWAAEGRRLDRGVRAGRGGGGGGRGDHVVGHGHARQDQYDPGAPRRAQSGQLAEVSGRGVPHGRRAGTRRAVRARAAFSSERDPRERAI